MKIVLIPYQEIYNIFIRSFFEDKNNSFVYENGQYIFTEKIKANIVLKRIDEIILDIASKYNSEYKLYIIDTCYPEHHYTVIKQDIDALNLTLKYRIDESDIVYNEAKLNQLFDKFFKLNFKKSNYNNITFIKHKKLNASDICYMFSSIYPSFILSKYSVKPEEITIDFMERKIPDKIRDSVKQYILNY